MLTLFNFFYKSRQAVARNCCANAVHNMESVADKLRNTV